MQNQPNQIKNLKSERSQHLTLLKIVTVILLIIMMTDVSVIAQKNECGARVMNVTTNCQLPVTIILTQRAATDKSNIPCERCNFHVEISHSGLVVCAMNWNPAANTSWCGTDSSVVLTAGKKEACKENFIDGESYHVRVTDSIRVIPGGEFDFVYHTRCEVQVSAPAELRQGTPFTFTVTGDVCDTSPTFSWQIKLRSDGSAVRSGTIQDAQLSQPITDLPMGEYVLQASTGNGCNSAEKEFRVKCARDDEDCDNDIDDNCNGQINEGCCKITSTPVIIDQRHTEWFNYFRYKYITFAIPANGSKPEEWKVTLDNNEEKLVADGDRLIFSDRIRYTPPKKEKEGNEKDGGAGHTTLKIVRTCKYGTAEQSFNLTFQDKMIVMEP